MRDYETYGGEPEGLTFGHREPEADELLGLLASGQGRIDEVSPHELGRLGEELAARYLEGRGWHVAERNWACPRGEADIIAYDGDTCVLVEVKTRLAAADIGPVAPELAVDASKRERYRGIARCYLAYAGIGFLRFDVIAISILSSGTAHIHHIESAFGDDL